VWGHVRDKESNSWGRRVTHSICKGSSRKWQITMMQQKKHHPVDWSSHIGYFWTREIHPIIMMWIFFLPRWKVYLAFG
jgi:hypothetical protein